MIKIFTIKLSISHIKAFFSTELVGMGSISGFQCGPKFLCISPLQIWGCTIVSVSPTPPQIPPGTPFWSLKICVFCTLLVQKSRYAFLSPSWSQLEYKSIQKSRVFRGFNSFFTLLWRLFLPYFGTNKK